MEVIRRHKSSLNQCAVEPFLLLRPCFATEYLAQRRPSRESLPANRSCSARLLALLRPHSLSVRPTAQAPRVVGAVGTACTVRAACAHATSTEHSSRTAQEWLLSQDDAATRSVTAWSLITESTLRLHAPSSPSFLAHAPGRRPSPRHQDISHAPAHVAVIDSSTWTPQKASARPARRILLL
jgi:hypothetical protein